MHKRAGIIDAVIDHWFNGGAKHDKIFSDADNIRQEYEADPNGLRCQNHCLGGVRQ